jgi:mxaA protein
MWRVLASGLVLVLAAGLARAQTATIQPLTPRPFGYFVGDVIRHEIIITAPPDYELLVASLPAIGPSAYWLDLVDVKLDEIRSRIAKRYRLRLAYQNFYVALDSRTLQIPSFSLAFVRGASRIEAAVPAWPFEVSPLREVQPAAQEKPADYLRSDRLPPLTDLHIRRMIVAAFGIATLLAINLLAYQIAWWPFRKRLGRSFTNASRKIRGELGSQAGTQPYLDALLRLHRAIDKKDGQRVFAEDLPNFLERHPEFRRENDALTRFFAVSRKAFFGDDPVQAKVELPPADFIKLAERLAAAERGIP